MAQKQHAGLLDPDAQPSGPASVFLRAHDAAGPCLGAPGGYMATDPNREPGRTLIPGDGTAGHHGGSETRQW
jgi:hypothetical protein